MPDIEEKLAHHGVGIGAVRLLDKQQVAELAVAAKIGECVFVAARTFELTCIAQP